MDITLVIGGEAGQGINTISYLLLKVFKKSGLFAFSCEDIMSRIRGGVNTTTIRISEKYNLGFKKEIDILVPLDPKVEDWVKSRLTPNTIILNEDKINLSKIKKELENPVFLNTFLAGLITRIFDIDFSFLKNVVEEIFYEKGVGIVEKNILAAKKGYDLGDKLNINISIKKSDLSNWLLLSGSEAVALGCLAGGCNFVGFYPMSPSTGVAIFLASQSKDFGIVVEQFEDEIAAICSAIGVWFAGGRGLVTTSGGGFALMEEALSLAGMSETPLVIHLAQRPGPATGLPTRTMQGDLNLALYAGHGEFPRIILSPCDISEAFYLSAKAFNLADKYQVPVFILTDQYLMDGRFMVEPLHLDRVSFETYFVKTDSSYRRYEITSNGISPRGIPGYGEGIVIVNGNEHDEWGDITEDETLNTIMAEKRWKKGKNLFEDIVSPKFFGPQDYEILVVSWGSTYHTVKETIVELNHPKVAHLHYSQLWPLNLEDEKYFNKAKKVYVVEQNLSGQFANLLRQIYLIKDIQSILKYNGRPFSVEELKEKFA